MQGDLAARITAGVVRSLFPAATAAQTRAPAPAAYALFLNGRYWRQKNARQAICWFEQATVRDARFAAAWSAIADSATGLALSGQGPAPESFEKARHGAEEARRLDESLAEAAHGVGTCAVLAQL